MNQYRFFVSPDQITDSLVTLDGNQAHQICNVLRMRELQTIEVLDNSGWRYEVCLEKVASDLVTGSITTRERAKEEPNTVLTLYQALLKKDNFEWILQKGTEIGVSRFVPLITERCVVRPDSIKPAKLQRWQRIVSEAAEQSGRGILPELSAPIRFKEAVESSDEFNGAFIPWVRDKRHGLADSVRSVLGQQPSQRPQIALFIGPEGGFSESEVADAVAAGVRSVTLGPRILRSETAAIVSSTLALAALGDL